MDDTSSIPSREEGPVRRCLSLSECSWWHTLVFIMGVLTMILGLFLIMYRSYHEVAFAVGICMIVASFTAVVLSHVPVASNTENLAEGPAAGRRAESHLYSSQTLVLATTRL